MSDLRPYSSDFVPIATPSSETTEQKVRLYYLTPDADTPVDTFGGGSMVVDHDGTVLAEHEDCRCYECDTIDALLGDIAHYWDLDDHELAEAMR